MTDVVIVLTTVPAGGVGETIARALVGDSLAACVNISAPMTSFYRWKGDVEQADECQLVIKTVKERVKAVQARIGDLHPYDLPEFLVLDAIEGSGRYLDWVRSESGGSGTASIR